MKSLKKISNIFLFAPQKCTTMFSFFKKDTTKQNSSIAVCASSMYKSLAPTPIYVDIYVKLCPSRHCHENVEFSVLCTWTMSHLLYLSCGVPFPDWTPDNISG